MKILAVFGRHAYGDPARGDGYEFANILPDLQGIAEPGEVRLFDSWDRSAYADFAALNNALLTEVARFQPDVIFLVLMSHEIWTDTLDVIRANSPSVVVNWGTDDSWKYKQMSRYYARHVDLHITTHAPALDQAKRDGLGNVAVSQWAACGGKLSAPVPSAGCRYDVSFLGAKYGNRPEWVGELAKRGIHVDCFGKGWDNGVVATDDIGRIFQQSRVSLNFSDSGLQLIDGRITRSRQIKARTFEVPGAGGVLLTEPADGLDQYFDLRTQMGTFDSADELAGQIRRLLANPLERDAMAARGHERVVREHTYRARLPALFERARQTARTAGRATAWRLAPGLLDEAAARHAPSRATGVAASVLDRICRFVFGRQRGAKAARRLVHEVSWRLAGERTYSASGWPGRMFYRDV
ncbi:MAG: glycosyltransferase [Hyphomicrobiaceae bacterium]